MAQVKFVREKNDISNVPIVDGQFIILINDDDTFDIYSDILKNNVATRVQLSGGEGGGDSSHYESGTVVAGSSSGKVDTSSALTNGNVYLNHIENDTVMNSHNISGSGATIVTADSSGNIVINSTDNDTKVTSSTNHYTPATASGESKSASASGATAAWSIDVVKGVSLDTDGKGHVTGLSVTSGKIPANPNSHYTSDTVVTNSATGKTNTTSAISTNGNVYLNHIENDTVRHSHKISGAGRASVTADSSGNITITSTGYSNATTSAAGLMSSTDKSKLDGMITYGTSDYTAGTTSLTTGYIYCMYE